MHNPYDDHNGAFFSHKNPEHMNYAVVHASERGPEVSFWEHADDILLLLQHLCNHRCTDQTMSIWKRRTSKTWTPIN